MNTQAPTPPPPPLPGQHPTSPPTTRRSGPNYGVGTRTEAPTARGSEVALIIGAGFLANLAFRSSFATATAALSGLLVVAVLVVSGRELKRDSAALIGLAAMLLPWLVVRSNPALAFVTVMMILVLLCVASGLSRHGRLVDSKLRGLAKHIWAMSYEWLFGSVMVKRLFVGRSSKSQAVAIVRGVLVAAPVVALFALLLASADEVFAQLLFFGNAPGLMGHVIGTACISVALLGYLSRRAHETPTGNHQDIQRLGSLEVMVVLGGLVMLFSAFVITQIVVALGGADHVLQTEGLTQADHARRGFFQLLWVAGLSMALVSVLRAVRKPRSGESTAAGIDWFKPLAVLTLVLTVAIAGISVQRLLLYIGSFGLTPLRLWALLGAGAIAVAIVIYIVSVSGYRSHQSWYPAVAILLAFGVVFGLNVLNPDAVIANYNISEFGAGAELDVSTLTRLSDDAMPAVVDRLDDLGANEAVVVSHLCNRYDRETSYGFLEYNVAAVGSDRALDQLCGTRPTRYESR